MAVQENDETFPSFSEAWSMLGVSGKALQCPTAGKSVANAYGYNVNIGGLGMGEVTDTLGTLISADSRSKDNYLALPSEINKIHDGRAIGSYVDGHVAMNADGSGLLVAKNSLMNKADAPGILNASDASALNAGVGAGYLTSGGSWSVTQDNNPWVPNGDFGWTDAQGGTTGGKQNLSIYFKDPGSSYRTRSGISVPIDANAIATYSWESVYSNAGKSVEFQRTLPRPVGEDVNIWVLEMDYYYEPNEIKQGQTWRGFRIFDDNGVDIVDFLWSFYVHEDSGQHVWHGDVNPRTGIAIGVGAINAGYGANWSSNLSNMAFMVGPATSGNFKSIIDEVRSIMTGKWVKIRIVCEDGEISGGVDGHSATVSGANNWSKPSAISMWVNAYSTSGTAIYKNIKFDCYKDRDALLAANSR